MESDADRPAKIRKLHHADEIAEREGEAVTLEPTSPGEDSMRSHQSAAFLEKEPQEQNTPDAEQLESTEVQPESQGGLPPPEITAPVNQSGPGADEGPALSKNQQKKLRKQLAWEAGRSERKAVKKEKLKAKKERVRAEKKQQREENPDFVAPKQQPRRRTTQLPITIVIDCNFDDLMSDSERISLAGQVTRCYSDNKNALFRGHLTFCSFGGQLKQRFDTVLSENYKSWKGVRTFDCDFVDTAEKAKEWMTTTGGGKLDGMFSKYADLDEDALATLKSNGEVVYLSSESDETLTELKPYSTYIIGGLVDKNREKGICHKRAMQCGVRTARLPIGQFMQLQSRKVLATNHVNEIMVKWLESGDWGDAFMKVIPKRKGGTLLDIDSAESAREQDIGAQANEGTPVSEDDGYQSDAPEDNVSEETVGVPSGEGTT